MGQGSKVAAQLHLALPHSFDEMRAVRRALEMYRLHYGWQLAAFLSAAYLFLQVGWTGLFSVQGGAGACRGTIGSVDVVGVTVQNLDSSGRLSLPLQLAGCRAHLLSSQRAPASLLPAHTCPRAPPRPAGLHDPGVCCHQHSGREPVLLPCGPPVCGAHLHAGRLAQLLPGAPAAA